MMKDFSDMFWYVVVGLLVVLGGVWWVTYFPSRFEIDSKWIELILNTALLFGITICWYPQLRKLQNYWLFLFACLMIHITAFAFILTHIAHWPLAWNLITLPIEWMALMLAVRFLWRVLPAK